MKHKDENPIVKEMVENWLEKIEKASKEKHLDKNKDFRKILKIIKEDEK